MNEVNNFTYIQLKFHALLLKKKMDSINSVKLDVLKTPKVVSSGFAELEGSGEFFEKTSNMVLSILDQETNTVLELDVLRAKMTEMISDFLFKESRRRPTVLVIIEEV